MNRATRTMLRVEVLEGVAADTAETVERLMGTSADARFRFIQEHAQVRARSGYLRGGAPTLRPVSNSGVASSGHPPSPRGRVGPRERSGEGRRRRQPTAVRRSDNLWRRTAARSARRPSPAGCAGHLPHEGGGETRGALRAPSPATRGKEERLPLARKTGDGRRTALSRRPSPCGRGGCVRRSGCGCASPPPRRSRRGRRWRRRSPRFLEAVVGRVGLHRVVAQPPPGDGAADRRQCVEQPEEERIAGRLADGAVEAVVPHLVLPPGLRLARAGDAGV